VEGPLASYALGFGDHLAERGYRPRSVVVQLRLLAHLSGWLVAQGMEPSVLTVEAVERFMTVRRGRYADLTGARALGPMLGYLRGLGVVPELRPSTDSPVERLLVDYRVYLVHERG
jgi:integrase/recombinase XerD